MSIYVANLSYEVTEADLKATFAEYGSVKRVQLPVDRETGRKRGFGLVEMSTDAEEEAAIEALDGAEWMGRDLRVNKADPGGDRSVSSRRYDSGTAIVIGESSNAQDKPDYQKHSSISENSSRNSGHQRELNAFLKTESSLQKVSANTEITIILKGSLSDVSKTDLTILTDRLRKLARDSSIEIVQVKEGSIILKLSGTDEGFRVIKELWETGKLTTLIGLSIELVDYEDVLSVDCGGDSIAIENTAQVDPINKQHSGGDVNVIYNKCVVNQNNQPALSSAIIQTDIQGENMSEHFVNNLQGAKIGSMANVVKEHGRQQATQHNYPSESKKTLAEAAIEIQHLLSQLEQSNPTATEVEKVAHINDETTAGFKRRVSGALQASGEAAIDEFILENKYLKVAKAAVKGWLQLGS
jgi:hypothetical protein